MRDSPGERPAPLNVYVSASSRGLGLAIARQLAANGANVALSSRSQSHLDAARATILAESPRARVLTIPGDLAAVEDQDSILETLTSKDFQPHVFVCSSGQPKESRLAFLQRAHWEHDVEMILGQAVFAAKVFAPAMAQIGFGRFIFISSIHAKTPNADCLTSSVTRAGLFALSKAIASEYGQHGIASFPLCLGYIDTPLLRNMALGRAFDAPDPAALSDCHWVPRYREWADQIPAGRVASPSELAKLVAFLISPEAEYLNGTVLSFSGGLDRGLV